jgi:hypothetical protein
LKFTSYCLLVLVKFSLCYLLYIDIVVIMTGSHCRRCDQKKVQEHGVRGHQVSAHPHATWLLSGWYCTAYAHSLYSL